MLKKPHSLPGRKVRTRPVMDRFNEKINRAGECWIWLAQINKGGYAIFTVQGKPTLAHRFAYEHFTGPIPPGYDVDHTCHNEDKACPGGPECLHRRCVNPAHLVAKTRAANLRDSGRVGSWDPDPPVARMHRAKTHCPRGHPYDEENTYYGTSRQEVQRCCRACHRERSRLRRERLKNASPPPGASP